jgi:hypothetical protein
MRTLRETTEKGFAPCHNGRFEHNLVVFHRADVRVFVNVGSAGVFWTPPAAHRPPVSGPQIQDRLWRPGFLRQHLVAGFLSLFLARCDCYRLERPLPGGDYTR